MMTSDLPACSGSGWFQTLRHYVSVSYRSQQLGLLVETDDEDDARRGVEELCTAVDGPAKILCVRKVVLQ
jgi:hypothetical protein